MTDKATINFLALAQNAKAEHDARVQEEARKRALADAEDESKRQKAITVLVEEVRPLLEQAMRAFKEMGVPARFEESWKKEFAGVRPEIDFWCEGPESRNAHGGVSKPRSFHAFFQHDGKALRIGTADSEYGRHPGKDAHDASNSVQVSVERALKVVLETYYADVEKLRRQGLY